MATIEVRTAAPDMDLLELEGELQLLKSMEEQLRILETIEICP